MRSGRFEIDVIDPKGMMLPLDGSPDDPAIAELRLRLARCEAYVVVTPEYNHSFPAALKLVIDSAYAEWHRKPVAFVSYGGVSGGLRAVEQLRLVFAELQSVTTRTTVSIAEVWTRFDADGKLLNPEREEKTMARMLTELASWAGILHAGEMRQPAVAGVAG